MEENKVENVEEANMSNGKNNKRNKTRKKTYPRYLKCSKTDRSNLTVGKNYRIVRVKNSTHDILILDDNNKTLWITPNTSRKEQFSLVLD